MIESSDFVGQDSEGLGRQLQERGYRLTAARKAIISTLLASNGHLSSDDLALLVQRDFPGIGRMTVYRTLDLLKDLSLIRPVYHGTAAAHFIVMDQGHHHHLVCTTCKRVIDFDACGLRDIESSVSARHNFEIEGHLLEIYGRCNECSQ